jgi:hypothetical protein
VPTIKDRVVQMAALLVLEPIFEADLQPEQYAYRPGRSARDAVQQVQALMIQGHTEVVDADLSGYFDSIPHAELLKTVTRRVSEGVIRRAFGGTIYPAAAIVVEPLAEQGRWWQSVRDYYAEDEEPEEDLRPWRAMIRWFHGARGLHAPSFVMIGETPLSRENGGCVHPRLALAVTQAGSLVGIGGCVVHT